MFCFFPSVRSSPKLVTSERDVIVAVTSLSKTEEADVLALVSYSGTKNCKRAKKTRKRAKRRWKIDGSKRKKYLRLLSLTFHKTGINFFSF